jgi:hypothetical protein
MDILSVLFYLMVKLTIVIPGECPLEEIPKHTLEQFNLLELPTPFKPVFLYSSIYHTGWGRVASAKRCLFKPLLQGSC